jgi:hypothetical protein
MRCFFHGRNRDVDGVPGFNGLVSFAIPDIGITFRARYTGSHDECEYASLLALLEFVELNPHLFRNKRIEIYGNDYLVISQVNKGTRPSRNLEPYMNMAVGYRHKIPFTLNWIPDNENLAQDGLTTG